MHALEVTEKGADRDGVDEGAGEVLTGLIAVHGVSWMNNLGCGLRVAGCVRRVSSVEALALSDVHLVS